MIIYVLRSWLILGGTYNQWRNLTKNFMGAKLYLLYINYLF